MKKQIVFLLLMSCFLKLHAHNFINILSTDNHTVFLSGNGKIYSSGLNFYGQLGLGYTSDYENFSEVECNAYFVCIAVGEAIGRQVVLYQQYDHEIAALTLIFNRLIKHDTKLLSNNKIYHLAETEEIKLPFPHRGQGRFLVGNTSYTVLPSPLDPTLVKAVCMQESRCGFDQDAGTDIMQVNVLGDWVEEKSSLGLVYNKVPSPWLSLKAGIAWLISKGFEAHEYYMKGLEWKDKKWDYRKAEINNIRNTLEPNCALFLIYTWNGDWWKAVQKYNGGGTKNYSESVKSYYHNTRESVQSDYYVDDTLYIVLDILG